MFKQNLNLTVTIYRNGRYVGLFGRILPRLRVHLEMTRFRKLTLKTTKGTDRAIMFPIPLVH